MAKGEEEWGRDANGNTVVRKVSLGTALGWEACYTLSGWLRLCASTVGSIPAQGTKTLHAMRRSKNKFFFKISPRDTGLLRGVMKIF